MKTVFRLAAVLAACSIFAPWSHASVIVDDGSGEMTWLEDFHDPNALDTSAGASPGLDGSEVVNGSLQQILGGPRVTTVTFDDPSRFTFDPLRIRVDNGEASLRRDGISPYPEFYWRMEDAVWNGTPGEVSNTADFIGEGVSQGATLNAAGLIGQAASFDGASYLSFGTPAELDFQPGSDDLTLATWFRTTSDGALMGKAVNSASSRQIYLFLLNGRLAANMGGVQRSGSTSGLTDGQWHHAAVVNYDDAGTQRFALYVDGVLDGTFASGAATNAASFLIGGRRQNGDTGFGFPFTGDIDETTVFDRALLAGEVAMLYNQGAGAELQPFDSSGPSIVDTGIMVPTGASLDSFSIIYEFESPDVAFRLSTDGVNWQFFDGAVWRASTLETERNDVDTVNGAIASFPIVGERLYVESFLLSDGQLQPTLLGYRLGFTADTPAESSEILGPIEAGDFVQFSATVLGEDADHSVRFQILEADAMTPVSNASLPGNATGFSSALASFGVDLTNVNAQAIYLRLDFMNSAGDQSSAAVDELRVRLIPPTNADLAVTVIPPAGPVGTSDLFDFIYQVENLSPNTAKNVRLEITMPPVLYTEDAFPNAPVGWGCSLREDFEPTDPDGFGLDYLCERTELAGGEIQQISITQRLRRPFVGFAPIVARAAVFSANDPNDANDRGAASVAVDSEITARIGVMKTADVADGTDFSFLIDDETSFQLDARDSFDGDDIGDTLEFEVNPGSHSIQEVDLPPTWLLSDIICQDQEPFDTARELPLTPETWQYDPAAISLTGTTAVLLDDALRPGLVGYWRFNEESWTIDGSTLDESGLGHDGTFSQIDDPFITEGLLGNAGSFGAGTFVNFGQPAALDFAPATDAFTVGAWFRTTGDGAILGKAVGGLASRQFYLFVFQGRLWVNVGGVQHGATGQVIDDQWHHAMVVNRDVAGTMTHTLYLDGQAVGSWDSGSATNSADFLVGARRESANSGSTFHQDGLIDEVTAWDRGLDAAEIADFYAGGVGRAIGGTFPINRPSLTLLAAADSEATAWLGVAESTSNGSRGTLLYQVASREGEWMYWNGGDWSSALDSNEANDVQTLNRHLSTLALAFEGELWLRVFFASDGSEPITLDGLKLIYTVQPYSGFNVDIDGRRVDFDLRLGQDAFCTFHNSTPQIARRLTFTQKATPQDGTDFFYAAQGINEFIIIDDAAPDDGDAVPSSVTFEDLPSLIYTVESFGHEGFTLDGFSCTNLSSGVPLTSVADFATGDDYLYDPERIEVDSGVRLRDRRAGLAGYWPIDSGDNFPPSVPEEVLDNSGNGNDGTPIGAVTEQGGAAVFSGAPDVIDFDSPPSLDFDPASQPFTLSIWFNSFNDGALIGKAVSTLAQRQYYLFLFQGRLWANIGGEQNGSTTSNVTDGEWHHAAVVNYISGGVARNALYLDGQLEGDWLSGSGTNDADLLAGARRNSGNSGLGFSLDGLLDEIRIYDRALDASEIAGLETEGRTPVLPAPFDASGPSITTPALIAGDLSQLRSFTADLESGSSSQVGFQLSNDRLTWQYWNGLAWVQAAPGEHNDAATVNSAISSFPVTSEWMWVRAFLFSDGFQPVGLERIEIELDSEVGVYAALDWLDETSTALAGWVRYEGTDLECELTQRQVSTGPATVNLSVVTDPADGTDISLSSIGFPPWLLDDAMPDDGDSVNQSIALDFEGTLGAETLRFAVEDAAGLRPVSFDCTQGVQRSSPDTVQVSIEPGQSVDCTAFLSGQPRDDLEVLTTEASGIETRSVVVSADGATVAWTSSGGPTPDPENDLHVFVRQNDVVRQLTNGIGSSQLVALSPSGRYVAFVRDWDLLDSNPDLSQEIFRVDLVDDSIDQITDTDGCHFDFFSIDDGGRIAFNSSCSTYGGEVLNPDETFEIVVWDGEVFQLTDLGHNCSSSFPSLSGDGQLPMVAFVSTCDLVGLNSGFQDHVFLWSWTNTAVPFQQLTRSANPAFPYLAVTTPPVMSADGRYVLVSSEFDPTGASPVPASHVVRFDRLTGESVRVDQLRRDESTRSLSMSADLRFVVGAIEDFATGSSTLISWDLSAGENPPARAILPLSETPERLSISVDPETGEARVFFSSSNNYEGWNPESNSEAWSLRLLE